MYKFTGQVATKEHETFEIPPEKQSVPERGGAAGRQGVAGQCAHAAVHRGRGQW